MGNPKTILCIASYEKGFDFMKTAKEFGARVFLLTSKSLEHASWPRDSIDEVFYMPDVNKVWNSEDMINGVSYLCRKKEIDIIVALDDFDVEKASQLREHLRIPGMGDTTMRYFRDKLAMRARAKELYIKVPDFIHVLNHDKLNKFLDEVEPPFVLKPRMLAGAAGITKINNRDEFWDAINSLGDKQSYYLLEKFIPGEIFHVDSIITDKNVKFALAHKYGLPPMEVAHDGRVFTSHTINRDSGDSKKLLEINKEVIEGLGLVKGISHSEFIKSSETGEFYFLETSARVGGANISELVKAASGLNLWSEWVKLELYHHYVLPPVKEDYAAIMLSLAKQKNPDLTSFDDPEIIWKLDKAFHAGLVIASSSFERVQELLNSYTKRFYEEFFTSAPISSKPTD
ncbi:MAG: ATP-grasp domain-containing protein [Ignavibacteriaceae bacterium]|jgi:biotin carboxylase|nr:ATP-grasp domain-containing protein [Ignavibacteriaceae bacterium]